MNRLWIPLLGLVAAERLAACGPLEPPPTETTPVDGSLLISRVSVVDSHGGGSVAVRDLWIEGDVIAEIAPAGSLSPERAVTAPRSHPIGTIWGLGDDVDPDLVYERGAVVLADVSEAWPLVKRKVSAGVDGVKVVIEDGPGSFAPKPRLSLPQLRALAEAAHEHGLPVFAHVSRPEHVIDAVRAGLDGVMHRADPLSDIRNTMTLAAVVRSGVLTTDVVGLEPDELSIER